MEKHIDCAKGERMHSADVIGKELEKARERKMQGAGENGRKFSDIRISQKAGDIVRDKSVAE